MIKRKTSAITGILLAAALILWILFSAASGTGFFIKSQASLNGINSLFKNLGLGYILLFKEVVSAAHFTKYCVLGIIAVIITQFYSRNVFKNITIPLFLGLMVAVSESYLKSVNNFSGDALEIIISFMGFCTGIILYMVFVGRSLLRNKSSTYKSQKYVRRR